MCMACGEEFADRRCDGSGCDEWAYCYYCWYTYHPQDEPEWVSHQVCSNVHYSEMHHRSSSVSCKYSEMQFRRIEVVRCRCSIFPNLYACYILWDPRARYQTVSEEGYVEILKLQPELAEVTAVPF